MTTAEELAVADRYEFGWADPDQAGANAKRGLNEDVVREISALKGEPEWMTKFRLRSLEIFESREIPDWGGDLSELDYQDIYYYIKPVEAQGKSWDDVPQDIKDTFDKLGISLEEQKRLANVAVDAVIDSVSVKTTFRETLAEKGVIFCSFSEAVHDYPELVKQLFTMTAHEVRLRGAHLALTPVVDVARDPRWGRIAEGSGEDPYLGSMLAAARVRGLHHLLELHEVAEVGVEQREVGGPVSVVGVEPGVSVDVADDAVGSDVAGRVDGNGFQHDAKDGRAVGVAVGLG